MKSKRSKHSPAFKAKVALTAIREQETTAALARRYKLNANLIYKWKKQFRENVTSVFEAEPKASDGAGSAREAELLQDIGELTVERNLFLKGAPSQPMRARRAQVTRDEGPSMRRQCESLAVTRSTVYYEPVEPDAEQLAVMRRMDELHLKHPFFR